MTQIIRPKNWHEFQHYKDRNPSWIKLHKKLLDDFEFHSLPVASRALAPMLWLLASEEQDASIVLAPSRIAFRLRMTADEVSAALEPLLSAGFFEIIEDASEVLAEPEQDASAALAERYPDASLETQVQTQVTSNKKQGEEKNARGRALAREGAPLPPPPEKQVLNEPSTDFDVWWDAYPVKKARDDAEKSYLKARSRASPEVLLAAAKRYAAEIEKPGAPYAKYPQKWLDEGRWLDATGPPNGLAKLAPEHAAAVADKADKLLKRGKYAEH